MIGQIFEMTVDANADFDTQSMEEILIKTETDLEFVDTNQDDAQETKPSINILHEHIYCTTNPEIDDIKVEESEELYYPVYIMMEQPEQQSFTSNKPLVFIKKIRNKKTKMKNNIPDTAINDIRCEEIVIKTEEQDEIIGEEALIGANIEVADIKTEDVFEEFDEILIKMEEPGEAKNSVTDLNYATHTKKLVFQCDQCYFETDWHCDFKRHLLTHRYLYRCAQCEFKSANISTLKTHMSDSHNICDKSHFQCDSCEFKCASICALLQHRNDDHDMVFKSPKIERRKQTSAERVRAFRDRQRAQNPIVTGYRDEARCRKEYKERMNTQKDARYSNETSVPHSNNSLTRSDQREFQKEFSEFVNKRDLQFYVNLLMKR